MEKWERFFARWPTKLIDGTWAWRREIERRWNPSLNWWGDSSGYGGADGGWEYRAAKDRELEFVLRRWLDEANEREAALRAEIERLRATSR